MAYTQYAMDSLTPISEQRMTKVFGRELARGTSLVLADIFTEGVRPPMVGRNNRGFGMAGDELWNYAAARQLDALINRDGSRALRIQVADRRRANVSLRGVTAFTDDGGLAVSEPATTETPYTIPETLYVGRWLEQQIQGFLYGIGDAPSTSIALGRDNVEEVVVSLPWPTGATKVELSIPSGGGGQLTFTTRAGLLLHVTALSNSPFRVTASFDGLPDRTIELQIDSGDTDLISMEMEEFESVVNGTEVGGWGYAGFKFITDVNEAFGELPDGPVLYDAGDSAVAPAAPVGTFQATRLPEVFWPNQARADTQNRILKQLRVVLYGIRTEE